MYIAVLLQKIFAYSIREKTKAIINILTKLLIRLYYRLSAWFLNKKISFID